MEEEERYKKDKEGEMLHKNSRGAFVGYIVHAAFVFERYAAVADRFARHQPVVGWPTQFGFDVADDMEEG